MKVSLVCLTMSVCGLQGAAFADVFAFKDLEGFEKCLATDFLVEGVKTDKGAQERGLGKHEIHLRCIESAVPVLGPLKSPETDLKFIEAVNRVTTPDNAIGLVGVLVDHGISGCNQLTAYSVVMKALSQPKAAGTTPFAKTKAVVKRCLKDKEFRSDFLEEKDHQDPDRSRNACAILLEEGLVKSCKKGS